jgi:hypothetical protein
MPRVGVLTLQGDFAMHGKALGALGVEWVAVPLSVGSIDAKLSSNCLLQKAQVLPLSLRERGLRPLKKISNIPTRYTAFLQADGLRSARIGLLTHLFGTDPEDATATSTPTPGSRRSVCRLPASAPALSSGGR